MIRVARIVPFTNALDLILRALVDTQNEDSVLFRDHSCAGSDRGGRRQLGVAGRRQHSSALLATSAANEGDADGAWGVEALAITVPFNGVVAVTCQFNRD